MQWKYNFVPGPMCLRGVISTTADEDGAHARVEPALVPVSGDNDLEQNIPANNLKWPDDLLVGPKSQMGVCEIHAATVRYFVLWFCLYMRSLKDIVFFF